MAAEKHDGVDDDQDLDETGTKPTTTDSYTVEVLQVIKDAQQKHGMRHGDFQRYRQYCARRIRRIRKSLHFAQGGKYKVQPKKITLQLLTDVRYLHLALVDAERCWSYAMQLKSEANTEPRKHFHKLSRMKKAVQHADLLVSLCESSKVDARSKLEAQAYCMWMKGTLQFELTNWKTSLELFNSAKNIYEKLASAFVDEIKEIYLQRVEEITPNIRYCAYNIGDQSAVNDLVQMRLRSGREDPLTSRLDELIEKTREKQASTLSEVTWKGRTVPVKNEQVRVFLLTVQQMETQLSEADSLDSKLSVYESLMKELIEAQQSLREENKEDPTFKAIVRGQKPEGKVPANVFLHTYLMYLRQTKTIERNLLMIESLKSNTKNKNNDGKKAKPQDLTRLYDIIIQNLSDVPNLPGLDEDNVLAEETETRILGYKAFRCFYMAQMYSQNKKWPETIALYERSLEYAQKAVPRFKKYNGPQMSNVKTELAELERLQQEVDGLKYSCRAASLLDTEDLTYKMATLSTKNTKPLVDRLEQYVEDPGLKGKKANLAHFPPDFEPIQCKPLFFDVALSKMEFPSLEDKLEQRTAGGGVTGYLTSWLWGSKK